MALHLISYKPKLSETFVHGQIGGDDSVVLCPKVKNTFLKSPDLYVPHLTRGPSILEPPFELPNAGYYHVLR